MPSSSFPSNTSGTALLSPDPVSVGTSASPLHPSNIFDVEGLVAVITGGGTGIGLMMATALEHNGATVYIVGRRLDVLEKAARENNKYDKIIPVEGDITNRDSLLTIVDAVKARHGYIDLLVNNAGIARNLYAHPLPSPTDPSNVTHLPSPPSSPQPGPLTPSIKAFQTALWDTGSPDDFAETFATNVTAVYYTTIAFLDLLHQGNIRRQRLAFPTSQDSHASTPYLTGLICVIIRLIPTGSQDSLAFLYTVKERVYALGQVIGKLARALGNSKQCPGAWCLAKRYGALHSQLLVMFTYDHRSHAVSEPEEMTTSSTPSGKLDPDRMAETVPLRRVGTQEDMAGTILFLASRAGAYVNGAVWLVDGGRIGTVASNY